MKKMFLPILVVFALATQPASISAVKEINKDSKPNPVRTKNKSNGVQGEFKNIASIVDLTLLIPGQKTVELEPGNKKTMTHLEYYNYLKEKNNSEALKKFVEGLIGEVIEKYPDIFYSNNEPHNDKEKIATLTKVLLNEEKYKNKIVFYHGHRDTLSFFHDFVETIHRYLDLIKKPIIRSRFEGYELFESSDDFLQKYSQTVDSNLSQLILSTNTTLFGNTLNYMYVAESSLNFFYKNGNVKNTQDLVKNLCEKLGISYSKEMQDLYIRYKKIGGVLKQIFISPEHVNKISYISTPNGYAYKKPTALQSYSSIIPGYKKFAENLIERISTEVLTEQDYQSGKASLLYNSCLTTQQIIKLLRTNPEKIKRKNINRLQARILFYSKSFFDPAERKKDGIKQFDFYTTPEKQELREDLRREMGLLVKKLLWESLENNTLKNGAEKTELVTMYKKNQQKI